MHRIREHEADPNNTEEAYQEPTDRVDKVFTFWKDTYISDYHCWWIVLLLYFDFT